MAGLLCSRLGPSARQALIHHILLPSTIPTSFQDLEVLHPYLSFSTTSALPCSPDNLRSCPSYTGIPPSTPPLLPDLLTLASVFLFLPIHLPDRNIQFLLLVHPHGSLFLSQAADLPLQLLSFAWPLLPRLNLWLVAMNLCLVLVWLRLYLLDLILSRLLSYASSSMLPQVLFGSSLCHQKVRLFSASTLLVGTTKTLNSPDINPTIILDPSLLGIVVLNECSSMFWHGQLRSISKVR